MSEDIERHVVRKFDICQRLGKGVSFCHYFLTDAVDRIYQSKSHVIVPLNLLLMSVMSLNYFCKAYGVVWKAVEKKSRAVVALKKCFDAFRNATDAQRTFREIMYLQVRNLPSDVFT
jgi:hypothetical protein